MTLYKTLGRRGHIGIGLHWREEIVVWTSDHLHARTSNEGPPARKTRAIAGLFRVRAAISLRYDHQESSGSLT